MAKVRLPLMTRAPEPFDATVSVPYGSGAESRANGASDSAPAASRKRPNNVRVSFQTIRKSSPTVVIAGMTLSFDLPIMRGSPALPSRRNVAAYSQRESLLDFDPFSLACQITTVVVPFEATRGCSG